MDRVRPESRPGREAADGARLEHGDGRISIAGAPALEHPACSPGAKAPGLFGHTGPDSDLLALPDPSRLGLLWRDGMTVARELDLRTGVLQQRIADGDASAVVRSFCCLARPGTYVLRADGDAAVLGDGPPLRAPAPAAPPPKRGRSPRRRDYRSSALREFRAARSSRRPRSATRDGSSGWRSSRSIRTGSPQ